MPEQDDLNALPLSRGAKTDRAARKLEIADRRRQIAGLLLRRVSQREIARALHVSTGTVSEDMKAVRREWIADAQIALEQHIAHELAILNNDELELRTEMIQQRKGDFDLYLRTYDRVIRVMIERRKLLGLDAPIRLDLARAEARRLAEEFDLDPVELLRMAEEIVAGNR